MDGRPEPTYHLLTPTRSHLQSINFYFKPSYLQYLLLANRHPHPIAHCFRLISAWLSSPAPHILNPMPMMSTRGASTTVPLCLHRLRSIANVVRPLQQRSHADYSWIRDRLPDSLIIDWSAEECADFVSSLGLRQYGDQFLGGFPWLEWMDRVGN